MLIVKGSFFLFSCTILFLSVLGLSEFYRMALPDRKVERYLAVVLGSMLPVAFLSRDYLIILGAVTLLVLFSALLFLFRITDVRRSAGEASLFLMGFFYVPFLLGHLILVRGEPFGSQWVLLLLVIVMSGDSAAYYVGSSFGRNKLYPVVSPNKSREGAVGGLAGSIIGALCFKWLFFPELTVADAAICAFLLGMLGQVGDLFESLLKRSFGVKDSGQIVPGHGGILDRLDSILFAAPALFYYACMVFAKR